MLSRFRTVAPHLLYWLLFFLIGTAYNAFIEHQSTLTLASFIEQISSFNTYVDFGRIVFTFYVSLWVFTHFFRPRNIALIFGQVLVLGLGDATLAYGLDHLVFGPLLGHWLIGPGVSLYQYLGSDLTASWLYVMLAFLFKHLRDHVQSETLRHEKNAIELAYLKSQLNPHFLFNSLNNLYGLALTEPARTPDAILRLAELLRYMLYESNEPRVALAQEVAYLRSYIALETLRHEGEVHVDFAVEGPIEDWQIAPLLLISFVENAFKHGSVHNPARPIRLRLAVGAGRCSFTAENQVVARHKDQVGGVGLASVRRRLALLYPGRHRLDIAHEADNFRCALTLEGAGPAPRPAAGPARLPAWRPAGPAPSPERFPVQLQR